MKGLRGKSCKPIIECLVVNPYESENSLLVDSECVRVSCTDKPG